MYLFLKSKNYFVEVLNGDLTTFNASYYGTLLLVDSEEEFTEVEKKKLKIDIEINELSIAVFADWYNVKVFDKIKFFDDNTVNYKIKIA
jgi:membrane-bound transcription factor site-1 protease